VSSSRSIPHRSPRGTFDPPGVLPQHFGRRWRKRRSFLGLFLAFTALLLLIRLLLPHGIERYVLHVLNGLPGYQASLEDLDLNLWRGAYEIEGLVIDKVHGGQPEPFVMLRLVDLSIEWPALLQGQVVGEVELHQPVLQATLAGGSQRSETGTTPSWPDYIRRLFPFRINRFTVRDGELRLESLTTEPEVDLFVDDFYLEVLNLTNVGDLSTPLIAQAEAAGRPLGIGELEVSLRFDPLAEPLAFDLDAELREIPVVELNDFLQAYGNVDAESGTFSAFAEFAARDGRIEGYVKTLFEDLELLTFREIEDPGDALEFLWEGLLEVASEVIENQAYDRLATKVPLRGELGDARADMAVTVVGVLRNAIVAAFRPAIDDSIQLVGMEIVEKDGGP
jgi:hypothetical protein